MREDERGSAEPGRAADDRLLLARIGQRDQVAFAALYDRHADGIYGTVLRFIRDRSTATEIVQDTFMAVWQRGSQFNPEAGSVIGWMLGIARNRSIDRLRAEARRPLPEWIRPEGAALGEGAFDRGQIGQRGRSDGDDPAAEMDRRWLRAVIQTALTEIPPNEREILVFAYDRELSQSEIAARLGLPIGTVKSRTRRALARLRVRLELVPEIRDPGSATARPTRMGAEQ